ncbi:MAG: YjbQ family protein, partial [Dehalococcoidia bacterium]|nr:YjbQ family protein [Dehalococcoidia bacterium]
LLREQMPLSRNYRHSYEGAENAVAHLAGMMVFGESTWAPVRGGKLDLGTWQRLFLIELFEPRTRTVDVAVLGQ